MKINYTNTTSTIGVQRLETLYLIEVSLGDIYIPFVFDTGATMSLMNQTTATRFKAIPDSETITGGGTAGRSLSANTAIIPVIQIGEATIEDLRVVVVDDKQLDFGETENGNQLIINGFLGWDIIQHFKWQYNKNDKCLNMTKSIKEQVTTNLDDWDNMPILHVLLNEKDELFGIDTGNTESILGERMYHTLSNSSESTDVLTGVDGINEETVRIAEALSFSINGKTVILKQVSAINRQVFPTSNARINGLLGADIIDGRSWTLDYGNRIFNIS
jgi:hypothetical protein